MRTFQSGRYPQESKIPEIVVYPHRRRTRIWFLIGIGGSFLLFFFFLLILALVVFVPASRNGGAIFLALLMGSGAISAIWPTRTVAHLFSSGEPMLVITHQGIRVCKLYGSSEIVFHWGEIEAIFLIDGGIEPRLALCPREVATFLSRLLLLFLLQ